MISEASSRKIPIDFLQIFIQAMPIVKRIMSTLEYIGLPLRFIEQSYNKKRQDNSTRSKKTKKKGKRAEVRERARNENKGERKKRG